MGRGVPGRRRVCLPAPRRSGCWTLLKKKGIDSSGSCVPALTLSPHASSLRGGVQTPDAFTFRASPETGRACTSSQTPTCFGPGLLYVGEPEFSRLAAHHGAQMWTARWPHLHPAMCTTAGPLGTENLCYLTRSPTSPDDR